MFEYNSNGRTLMNQVKILPALDQPVLFAILRSPSKLQINMQPKGVTILLFLL